MTHRQDIRALSANELENVAGGYDINQTPFARTPSPSPLQGLFGGNHTSSYVGWLFSRFIPVLR